ncbi:MAG: hypothetical protein HY806_09500 [Nitrospirae bacterium]|nr:hypothetical protein [Nitrospirota bacterium]MBI4839352.1 hypothetical protein [Nitrospirota bacterium]
MADNSISINFFVKSLYLNDYNKVMPSHWIRCLQLMKYFKGVEGLRVTVNNFTYLPDILVIMRGFGRTERLMASAYKRLGTKVVWDTCVNYFETDSKNQQINPCQITAAHKMIKNCDAVFTASRFVNNIASKYITAFYLTDTVDKGHFSKWKNTLNLKEPVLGWSGFAVKAGILQKFKKFLERHKLLIISEKAPALDLNYDFIKWDYRSFPEDILKCDIMFSPRELDDMYNLGHSIFKVGVFLAAGVPVIADPVPSYSELRCPHLYLRDTANTDIEKVMAGIDADKREWDERFSAENIVGEYYKVFKKLCSSVIDQFPKGHL